MNALVNYTSDSDPEFEQEDVSHATTTKRSISQRPNLTNNTNNNCTIDGAEDDGDENYVAAALKDIRNLATIAPAPPSNHIMQCTSPSPMQDNENEGLASEDLEVMAFLKTIEDIPYPSDEQDAVLLPPPPPPPSIAPTTVTPPPPPPPPPPPFSLLEASLDVQPGDDKSKKALETTLQDIHTIQNRLYYISLLPSSTVDQKDLDRRLLEFATRVKDWEKGGLYESYFVGKERAEAMANNTNFYLSEAEKSTLPPFGGVMGTMIKHMYDLENIVAPPGWIAVWDADDEAAPIPLFIPLRN
ncbi:hypothetical protein BCR41DRAFT_135308 [Lobosporangium transversale]|uniref:Uncharacterized protein n=1 Tax=Lobosporangium transversale TaxID=64571 RepID=A0A1Y2GFZ1_9FUNG|nr:hypothetical protein BCR41DRAFT_135308 [Lobosporangium transversale]ORZ09720.1 hypothetical protein BCR41DRAFT_135308 [Lobosporangium transversale]|eukprot:XP_021878990.1 hypothetical protein BCR41DRAFT_135308 [Lobosporangium transversale]